MLMSNFSFCMTALSRFSPDTVCMFIFDLSRLPRLHFTQISSQGISLTVKIWVWINQMHGWHYKRKTHYSYVPPFVSNCMVYNFKMTAASLLCYVFSRYQYLASHVKSEISSWTYFYLGYSKKEPTQLSNLAAGVTLSVTRCDEISPLWLKV